MARLLKRFVLSFSVVISCALLSFAVNGGMRAPHPTAAQSSNAAVHSISALKEVRVSGSTRFTAQQVLRASGLHIREELTDANLQQAEQTLANSGAFTDVAAQLLPAADGETLIFKLTDMLPVVPCDFSQISGIDPRSLSAMLTAELPLFDGHVPITNPTVLVQVREHLQQILERKGIHGQVEDFAHIADLSAGTSTKSHVVQSMVFRVVNSPEK